MVNIIKLFLVLFILAISSVSVLAVANVILQDPAQNAPYQIIINQTTTNVNNSQYWNGLNNYTEIPHNDLAGLDGGTPGEYYHLTDSEHTSVQTGIISWITSSVSNLLNYYNKTQMNTKYYNKTSVDETFVAIGASNQVKIVYQNITNLPTCLGNEKLIFNGANLVCSPDIVGGGGAGTSKWVDAGVYLTTNLSYANNINIKGIVNATIINGTKIYQNTNIVCDMSNNCAYVTVAQGYDYSNFTSDLNSATSGWDKSTADDYTSVNFTANLGTKTTDNLAQGTVNKYDNQTWNQTKATSLYYLKTNPKGYYNISNLLVPVNTSYVTVISTVEWDKSAADDYTTTNFTANLGAATTDWDKDTSNDVTIGSANLTKVYCNNITGAASDLCMLVDTAKNISYVIKGSDNQVRIVYQNITNIPTCTGTNKLTFNGVTLSCSADLQGGEGQYLSKTGDTGIGNYIINGDFTQGYGFLAAPVGITGTLNYGTAGYLALNTTHSIRVYAYKNISMTRYYSAVGQASYYTDNNDQVSRYVINWSWLPTPGAEGYKVVKYDNRQGYSYSVGKDLGNVTSFVDGTDIVLSGVSIKPVGWYHFNSDTILNDSSIYGNDGTFPGTPEQFVTGKLGQAVNFTGYSGAIDIGNDTSLNIRDSISIEAWVKMRADGDYRGIVSKEYSASYNFGTGTNGEKALSFYYGGWEYKTINVLYFNNTWQHVVISYNRTNQTAVLYVDGIAYPQYIGFNPTVPGLLSTTYVGRQADGGFQLAGMLDEVVIYNDSLSADEVAFRYNNGAGREDMNSGYTVTYFSDGTTHTPTAGAYNIISKDNTFTSAINIVAEQDVAIVGYLTTGYPIKEANVSLIDKYYLKTNPKNYINSTTTHNFIKTNNITSKSNITGWDAANKTILAIKKGMTGNITKNFFYKKLNTTLTVQNVTTIACTATQKSSFNGIKFVCVEDIDTAKNNSYYLKTNPKGYLNTTTLPADPYNAKNSSYYLKTNPNGFYNTTTLPADPYNAKNNSYYLKTNPKGYLNTTTLPADPYNAKNSSYYLKTNPNGFYNTTTLPADPYNAKNNSYYLKTNPKNYYNTSTLIVPVNHSNVQVGSANKTKVYCGNVTGATSNLCTLVDTDTAKNTSYYLATNPKGYTNTTNYLSKSGDTGTGNYIFSGDLTQGYGFLAQPTGITGSLNYGAAGYIALGTNHSIRVYSYRTISAVKYYSIAGQSISYVDNNDQVSRYVIDWSWTPVDGAEGYLVLKYDTHQGYNYNVAKDVGNVTSFTDGTGITLSGTTKVPVAWYHFNSNTILNDSSIYGNDGTFVGTPENFVSGKLNQSLNFTGAGGVNIGNSSSLNMKDSISIEAWIKAAADGDYRGILVKDYAGSYYFGTGTGGEAAISFYYGASEFKTLNVLYFNNTWQHIALTFDRANQTVILYVDGTERSKTYGFNPTVAGMAAPTYVGQQNAGGFEFLGALDEVVVYNESLTPTEVTYRYNSGAGIDTMGGGYIVNYFTDNTTHTPTAGNFNIQSKGNTFTSKIDILAEKNIDVLGYVNASIIVEGGQLLSEKYYLQINPKGYLNTTTLPPDPYNAKNTSYYLKTNPKGYLNTTTLPADPYNAKNSSYYLTTNPKSYYNTSTLPADPYNAKNATYAAKANYQFGANNFNGSGNFTTSGYFAGQPIKGAIGSGIIYAASLTNRAQLKVNCTGLTCYYPTFTVRLIRTDNTNAKYYTIPAGSIVVQNDAYTVHFVDYNGNIQSNDYSTYETSDVSPGGRTSFMYTMAHSGSVELLTGTTLLEKEEVKSKQLELIKNAMFVISGFQLSTGARWRNFSIASGQYQFIRDIVSTSKQNTSAGRDVEWVYHNSSTTFKYKDGNALNVTWCDTGSGIALCTSGTGGNTKYRRHFIFMTGYNGTSDNSEIHQLLPLQNTFYTSATLCLDTTLNPLTYTLPSEYNHAAVMLYAYCAQSTETLWTTNFIDLRSTKTGSATALAEADPIYMAEKANYYLKTNPNGFYNTTTLVVPVNSSLLTKTGSGATLKAINYTDIYNAKNTSYYLRTNPKNYYNSSTLVVPVNSSLLTKTGSGATLKAINYTDPYNAKNSSYVVKDSAWNINYTSKEWNMGNWDLMAIDMLQVNTINYTEKSVGNGSIRVYDTSKRLRWLIAGNGSMYGYATSGTANIFIDTNTPRMLINGVDVITTAKNSSYYLRTNPKSYYNITTLPADPYNAKNTSYYLASNPKGYINVSIGDGAKNNSYYLASNPKSYYNISTLVVPVNHSYLTMNNITPISCTAQEKITFNGTVFKCATDLNTGISTTPPVNTTQMTNTSKIEIKPNFLRKVSNWFTKGKYLNVNTTFAANGNVNLTGNTTVRKIILDITKNRCIVTNATHIIISNNLSNINCGDM